MIHRATGQSTASWGLLGLTEQIVGLLGPDGDSGRTWGLLRMLEESGASEWVVGFGGLLNKL